MRAIVTIVDYVRKKKCSLDSDCNATLQEVLEIAQQNVTDSEFREKLQDRIYFGGFLNKETLAKLKKNFAYPIHVDGLNFIISDLFSEF